MPIPSWTADGILPPNNPLAPTAVDRSPYQAVLSDFVLHFSTTPERQQILQGYLNFRKDLHALGIVQGFQWVDGSFLEDVERLEGRAPGDLDVVTFAHLPMGLTQVQLLSNHPSLFNPKLSKATYRVDSYLVQMNGSATAEYLVGRSRYWYSVWSHRRSGQWKGYIELDLDPAYDDSAIAQLQAILTAATGGVP